MMVATVLEPTLEGIRAAIAACDQVADGFEIRFDACTERVAPTAVRALTEKPLIGTVRRPADGGSFKGEENDRLALLEACLGANFDFIDVEGPTSVPGPEERIIRSRHEMRATPSLATIHRMGEEITRNGATFKFAGKVHSIADTLVLLAASRRMRTENRPAAVMGMGEFPRALSHLVGSRFVYGGGRTNAPGQPALADVRLELGHWGDPSGSAHLYLVVGDPIAHSLSPRLHNAAFRETRLDASYGALRIPSGLELDMLLARANDLGLKGLSVTTPLKEAAFELCTETTPEAKQVQAVNAVKIDGTKILGHTTDGLGAKSVIARLAGNDARVLVLGTGGAARAIAAALPTTTVTVAGRSDADLKHIGQRLGVRTQTLSNVEMGLGEFDVLVNATRVEEPLRIDGFRGALFDLHYGSTPTAWERAAGHDRLRFAGGRELLFEQGTLAFTFWTGTQAPRAAMANALGVHV